ncbi:MAG: GAF domain-containing protein, partial [Planctomycetota bacterium]|nr:GAF domain-containing protein [Planctomycetota bacterium]
MPELPIPEERGAAQALSGASPTRQVLAALVALASDLSGNLDLHAVLDLALQRALDLMRAEAAAILLLAEDRQTLVCEAQIARGAPPFAIGQRLPLSQGIAGRAAATGRLYYTNDPRRDPYFAAACEQGADIPCQHIMCAPLCNRGRLLGVIEVRNRLSGQFSEDDAHLFQGFADLTAVAIANSR